MLEPPGMNAGLLVRRDDKLIVFQRYPLPRAFTEIENSASLCGNVRVVRKDPTAALPRTDCVGLKPS